MGIAGLLPMLKSIHKPVNLRTFEGKTIGVDVYGWLHRGAIPCIMDLATGKPTRKFVEYVMHRVRMLQHFGVTPYMIFDGDYLPSKAAIEKERARRREDSRRAGMALFRAGKTSLAFLEFQKAVDVTPEMARQVIDELRKAGVQYLVAPYEADAQMAYLERQGVIDAILSEDSDLLVYGSRCLLTKLDQYGNCVEINRADFCACRELSLSGWSDAEFRAMAILSGCDYLASINGLGLKTAYRMVRKHKTIERVVRTLQFEGKYHVPKDYLNSFYKAELTFLHQRVFCPKALTLVLNTTPGQPVDDQKLPFIGAYVEPETAQAVARGDLNPMTKEVIDVKDTMGSASKPWSTPRAGSVRSVSLSDDKKGVSIDKFSKQKRTPLAELDPNCFTPSPTQHATVGQNRQPWLANEAPRPYLNDSTANTQQNSQSESRTIARHRDAGPAISSPRPVKRARLCADVNSPEKHNVKSRFFAIDATVADQSPSTPCEARSRRNKKVEITIFCDDALDECPLNQPNSSPINNFLHDSGPTKKALNQVSITDEHLSTSSSGEFREEVGTSQSTVSFSEQNMDPSEALVPIKHLLENSSKVARAHNLQHKFGFTKEVSKPSPVAIQQVLPTPRSSVSSKSSKNPLAYNANTPLAKAVTKRALTPLQRLGASATNRSMQLSTPPITPTTGAPTRGRSLLSCMPFLEVQSSNVKRLDPASIPLPPANDAENIALATEKGSEDLIFHDSEEEFEHVSPFDGEAAQFLNVAQYVYTG